MKYLSDALLTAGAAAMSIGIGCIYWPAGIIAAGTFLMAGGVLLAYTGTVTPGKPRAA